MDIDEEYEFFDIVERNNHLKNVFYYKNVKRDHLLCNECEDILHENIDLKNFKIDKGIQVYIDLFSNHKWAYLVRHTLKGIVWNQYNCMVHIMNLD